MIHYNTKSVGGEYFINVETSNYEAYMAILQVIESMVRFIDNQYDEYDYKVKDMPTYMELLNNDRILIAGEIAIVKEFFLGGNANFLKVGDGKHKFSELPFIHGTSSKNGRTERELANILRDYSSERLKRLRKERGED